MAYTFNISPAEYESLQWIAGRYAYAEVLLDALELPDAFFGDAGDNELVQATIPEVNAWAIQRAVDEEDGWLPCMGGRLADELIRLLGEIV